VIVTITIQSGYKFFLVPVHIAISVEKARSCDTKTGSIIPGTQRPKYRFACVTSSVAIYASRI